MSVNLKSKFSVVGLSGREEYSLIRDTGKAFKKISLLLARTIGQEKKIHPNWKGRNKIISVHR